MFGWLDRGRRAAGRSIDNDGSGLRLRIRDLAWLGTKTNHRGELPAVRSSDVVGHAFGWQDERSHGITSWKPIGSKLAERRAPVRTLLPAPPRLSVLALVQPTTQKETTKRGGSRHAKESSI